MHFSLTYIGNLNDVTTTLDKFLVSNKVQPYLDETFIDKREIIKDIRYLAERFNFSELEYSLIDEILIDDEKGISYEENFKKNFIGFNILKGLIFDEYGPNGEILTRKNPNGKMEGYVVGGRVSGFFVDKNNNNVSIIQKKDLNFEAMIQNEKNTYAELWRDFIKEKERLTVDLLNGVIDSDFFKRELFVKLVPFFDTIEELKSSNPLNVDETIFEDKSKFVFTSAVIKDNKWYWFKDYKDLYEWNKIYSELISSTDENDYLFIIDCKS